VLSWVVIVSHRLPRFALCPHLFSFPLLSSRRSISLLKSTLTKVFILRNFKPFRMNTYEKAPEKPHFAQFWCNVSPFRMNTYEKQGGGGWFWLTSEPTSQRFRLRLQPTLKSFSVATSIGAPLHFRRRELLHSGGFEVEFSFVTRKRKLLEPFRRIA
jgi:hypothetical protein